MGGTSAPDGRDPHGREPELDDETVASRWAELTAELGALDVAAEEAAPEGEGRALPGLAAPPPPAGDPGPGAPLGEPDRSERPLGPADLAGPHAPTPAARGLGPRDYLADDDEDDEGYVPPEPAPLTHADPVLTLGWVATVASLVAGLVLALVWRPLPDGVLATLGGVLLAGVALLLWRMPSHRDDDPSGGAVV